MTGPAIIYQQALDSGEIQFDESQNLALDHLQRLFQDLTANVPATGLLSRLFGAASVPSIRGLYLWGGVGRGKTYLMDIFYESLPFQEKKRLHFHRFMRMVHRELHRLQGTSDPLKRVAADLSDQTRVLCFDEFFVSDITDAMILGNLLEELFKRGTVLVATSNVIPENLYQNGLQRRRFLPAIALIEKHTEIFNLDGSRDYRLRALQHAEIFHSPLDDAAEVSLTESFIALAPDVGEFDVALEIENRSINTHRCADGVVWFTFDEVCDGPRSQNDYIELARLYQAVLISGVPQLTVDLESQARRFISLVDEFYDRNVKLILSAAVPLDQLYTGTLLEFEFQRTESRLQEMQSQEFLSREHRP